MIEAVFNYLQIAYGAPQTANCDPRGTRDQLDQVDDIATTNRQLSCQQC